MTDIQPVVQDPKVGSSAADLTAVEVAKHRLFDNSDLMKEMRRRDPAGYAEVVRAIKKRRRQALNARTNAALDAAGLGQARELQP